MTTKFRVLLPVIVALAVFAGAQRVQAQAQVLFANNASTRITNCLTGGPLTNGTAYFAALYFAPDGTTDESVFTQVGASVSINPAGIFNGGNRAIPGSTGANAFMFQVRVWQTSFGGSWETASTAGPINCRRANIGKSVIVRVIPSSPAAGLGLPPFQVCPASCIAVFCPSNITVSTTNPAGVPVGYSVSGTNYCCPPTNTFVSCVPPSGSTFPHGTSIVDCTITDGVGPQNTCWFQVTVRLPDTHYASLTGSHQFPYTNWTTAATNIQSAVNAASDGDTVLVARGDYVLPTHVVISRAITLQSTNDRNRTILTAQGQFSSRCLYVSNSLAIVDGLTLRNGSPGGDENGGGIYMFGGTVRNCTVTNCQALSAFGGGVYMSGGVLSNSLIVGNALGVYQFYGGGVYAEDGARVVDCEIRRNHAEYGGAGAYVVNSELLNSVVADNRGGDQGAGIHALNSLVGGCTITNNVFEAAFPTSSQGGGAFLIGSQLHRCFVANNGTASIRGVLGGGIFSSNSVIGTSLIVGNNAKSTNGASAGAGGGIFLRGGSVINCTITGNRAEDAPGSIERGRGGGVFVESGTLTNTIIFANTSTSNANWYNLSGAFTYVCTTPNPGGVGNITGNPLFVNTNVWNYRLQAASPCIDAGTNQAWMLAGTDLDGNARIQNSRVDIGAYEAPCILAIGLSPTPQTHCVGSTAIFRATATGGAPLTYRWRTNGVDLSNGGRVSGATTTNLTITGLQITDAANYSLFVSNACGTVNSVSAALTMRTPPSVTDQFDTFKTNVGAQIFLNIAAGGSSPLSYQWRLQGVNLVNGGRIAGATTSTLAISGAQPGDSGTYSVVVSNSCGIVTNPIANVTVADCPLITLQPVNAGRCEGSTANFRFAASGTLPFYIQWFFNGAPLSNGDARITGTTTTNLSLTALQLSDAGTYQAVISNACGSATTVAAALVVHSPPQITLQPLSQAAYEGQTVSFTAAAPSLLTNYFQWRFNGAATAGATNTSLVFSNITKARAGDYTLVVTNSCGATTSLVATLAVPDCLAIAAQPVSREVSLESSVTFAVTPSGAGPFTYQWRFDGAPFNDDLLISGSAGPELEIAEVAQEHAGDYTVVISNFCGSVTSAPATLVLKAPFAAETAPPNLGDLRLSKAGTLRAVVVQPDGRIIVGGIFSSINGVPRNNLARLNPNGSVDATWDPEISGYTVEALALQGTDLFVGGYFTRIGGQFRNGLAKLSTTNGGEADPVWNPNVEEYWALRALAVSGTNVFVGGAFSTVGGVARHGLAKLSATGVGAVDPVWNADLNFYGQVWALTVAGGSVYAGGEFTSVRGVAATNLAKIALGGGGVVDASWRPQPDAITTAFAVSGSDLFVGGHFFTIAGTNRSCVAKFNLATGLLDQQWNPVYASAVYALAVRTTNLYVGIVPGALLKFSTTGTGTQDSLWNPRLESEGYDAYINAIAVTDTAVFAGGSLTEASGLAAAGITQLNPLNGARVPGFGVQLELPGTVLAMARQNDGRLVIGGDFLFAGGLVRRNIARLNLDSTVDLAWQPRVYGAVQAIALNGTSAFIGGYFWRVGTNDQAYVVKIDVGGSDAVDPNWRPTVNGPVFTLAVGGTNVFVGGEFSDVNGHGYDGISKLSALGTGAPDTNWTAGLVSSEFPTAVYALQLAGNDLYVGGSFAEGHLVRVSTSGSGGLDQSWHPNPGEVVYALALAGTNLYVGGTFTSVGGQPRVRLARVSIQGTGAVDDWAPIAHGTVRALAPVGDDVYVGGDFTEIAGENRSYLAKISGLGTGTLDPTWQHEATIDPDIFYVYDPGVRALVANGADLHVGGHFTDVDAVRRIGYVFLPIPDAPSMFVTTNTTIIIQRNAADGTEIIGFRITEIIGGDLFMSDGTTRVNAGDWVSVADGEKGLKFVGTNEVQSVSAVSSFNRTPEGTGTTVGTIDIGAGGLPAFSFSRPNYEVTENVNPALAEVTIIKRNPGAASVSFFWQPLTALPYAHHQGDVLPLGNVTTFYFGADQTSTNIEFFIYNDDVREGDEQFVVTLFGNSPDSVIVEPSDAIVTILDDECTGAQGSFMVTEAPGALPPLTGGLKLQLEPDSGQWRLAGDPFWRGDAETASGLSPGVYEVAFRPLESIGAPFNTFFHVTEGETNEPPPITYPGLSGALGTGWLTVRIRPSVVAAVAQWRAVVTQPSLASDATAELQAGTYEIHFTGAPAGWNPPTDLFAVVANGFASTLEAHFTEAQTTTAGVPVPLELSQVLNEAPYFYNGMIETEVPSEAGTQLRFGSGVVVKERVVLTAAHVLFDDVNFTFVRQARWYLQKHAAGHEPRPLSPQGWYIRAGYDAQRRAENTPGLASPASQALDVAAMFFAGADNLPGRGGFGGFVASDNDANEWLRSTREKKLVGYPMNPTAVENHGRMHATPTITTSFLRVHERVYANTSLQSFPGNSGGPLYVRADDDQFYPAAVYLGGAGQLIARAIDRHVVCLINSAEQSGSGGGHHVGGGVALWEVGDTEKMFTPGLFGVVIEPPAVRDLARWHVRRSATDVSADFLSGELIYPTAPGEFTVAFTSISGWGTPTNRLGIAFKNQINRITNEYVPLFLTNMAVRAVDGAFRFQVHGAPGRRYKVNATIDLETWSLPIGFVTNENRISRSFLDFLPRPEWRFYRVKEDPDYPVPVNP